MRSPVNETPATPEYLSIKQVAAMLNVSVRTAWKLHSNHTLPKPIYLTPRCPRWIRSAVVERIEQLAD